MRADYSGMSAADLEQMVGDAIFGLPGESAENFMSALGSIGKAVAPTLQRAAPGIAQGAASGAAVGGPWGALIGAGAGLASSAMSRKARAPRAASAPPLPPQAPASQAAPGVPALPSGQGAAATLLGLFQNPTVQQALLSQVLGAAGDQDVPAASGAAIPRAAINNLLTQLLASASEGLGESEAADESYLRAGNGAYIVDPASPEQQAALVLAHLGRARALPFEAEEDIETVGFY